MKHLANPAFWIEYEKLSKNIQILAGQKFGLLKKNPRHPSLHLKKVGKYWSVRVGLQHRALAVEIETQLVWFWIGNHAQYEELLK